MGHPVTDGKLGTDLEGSEVRVDAEDVDELEVGEDVGGGEEALRDQHRVPRVPLVSGAKLWLMSHVIFFYDLLNHYKYRVTMVV